MHVQCLTQRQRGNHSICYVKEMSDTDCLASSEIERLSSSLENLYDELDPPLQNVFCSIREIKIVKDLEFRGRAISLEKSSEGMFKGVDLVLNENLFTGILLADLFTKKDSALFEKENHVRYQTSRDSRDIALSCRGEHLFLTCLVASQPQG